MASCINTVGCPKCGAKIGEFCKSRNIMARIANAPGSLHAQRVELYEAQR